MPTQIELVGMRKEKEFNIQFSGLKIGTHEYEYLIENDFFELFDYQEYEGISVEVKVVLVKKETLMEVHLTHSGTVYVPCDVSGEYFDLPIEGFLDFIVKFGEEFNNENEELLILPHGEYQFNIAQYIYESIVLSVPQKRVHPDYQEEDDFDEDEFDFLSGEEDEFDDFDDDTEEINENNTEIDPRWEELKKLLTDK